MHAGINVRVDLGVESDKTVPLAAIAESLEEEGLGARALEGVVERLDEELVESYCGEKHAQGNGDQRYQRAGTSTRSAVTTLGEHEFTLHYVKDTAAEEDENTYFRPIEKLVQFDDQRIYQEDISAQAVELATTSSYRDAVEDGEGSLSMPSKSTILRRVEEYGQQLQEFFEENIAGTAAEIVIPDGTDCPSQDEDRSQHGVDVTLGDQAERDEEGTTLLDVSVNDTWEEIATILDESNAIATEAAIVSDAKLSMVDALLTDERIHQLDLLHLSRTSKYYLWKDGQLPLEERIEYVEQVEDIAFHLKNSVEKHAPMEQYSAIRYRLKQTRERLRQLAEELAEQDCQNTAEYLRKWTSSVLTFAQQAVDDVDGVDVPWTSNPVERAMGALANRCKDMWMRWTEQGLESMLTLVLVEYANPDLYEQFFDEMVGRSNKTSITCEVSVEATRGEL